MPRNPDLPCADCGKMMWRGKGVLPAGQARCQPCRRIRPTMSRDVGARHSFICEECGNQFARAGKRYRFCSTRCSGDYQSRTRQVRSVDDCRVKRIHREHASPGLSTKRRSKLLHTWRAQGRTCAYCPRPADTVDHVVPLVRGGTNYEGNLVPACRRCNSSKSGKTVVEWRTGKTLPRMVTSPGRQPKPPRVKAVKQPRPTRPCRICQTPTVNLSCSAECRKEHERRHVRDSYRAAHGLHVDPSRPTSKWRQNMSESLNWGSAEDRALFTFRSDVTPTPSRA